MVDVGGSFKEPFIYYNSTELAICKGFGGILALFEPKTAGTLWVPAFSCKAKKWPLYDKKDDERDQEPVEEVFG